MADPHPLVRAGLHAILTGEPTITVIGEASSKYDVITASEMLRPAVVVIDIELVRRNGVDLIQGLRGQGGPSGDGQHRPTGVLVLADSIDCARKEEEALDIVRAGARGLILKSGPPDDVINAVRLVAVGHAALSPCIARILVDWVAAGRARERTRESEKLPCITKRERDVLLLLAEGLSNAEIADRLVVRISTVKSHLYHLLQKLDLKDRTQAVAFAYRSGLVSVS